MNDEDRWFGVFQRYRPDGDGVEEVFVDLPDATEYADRIRSVCRATSHPGWERDAYFIVRSPKPATEQELVGYGEELLAGLRLISLQPVPSGDRELHKYLEGVTHLITTCQVDTWHDDHTLVHESVGDILQGLQDADHRAVQLGEGFYSVACDYWLAWYLMWPYFRGWVQQEVFRPYFELWLRGCSIAFQGDTLCIARPVEHWPRLER